MTGTTEPTTDSEDRAVAGAARWFHEVHQGAVVECGLLDPGPPMWDRLPEPQQRALILTFRRLIEDNVIRLGASVVAPLPPVAGHPPDRP